MRRLAILAFLTINISAPALAEVTAVHEGAIKVGAAADSCSAGANIGALRYSSSTIQYCNGTAWTTLSKGAPAQIDDLRDARASYSTNFYLYLGAGSGGSSTAAYNVGAGRDALSSNTTGTRNTAIGMQSLMSNTTGTSNTGFGYRTLASNLAGNYNVAFGYNALEDNTGSYNTAFGSSALENNTTGEHNTAAGYQAMQANTTGSYNTVVGTEALKSNLVGSQNTALGYRVLMASTGDSNTGAGHEAAIANTSGQNNTAIGHQSFSVNTTGSDNTAVGKSALDASNSDSNVAIGFDALGSLTSGAYNTAAGYQAGMQITTGSYNTAIGYQAGPVTGALSNTTCIGNGATVGTSNYIRFGNGSIGQISGQVGWTNPSDRRDKDDIQDSDLGLDFIKSLRPVSYRLNDGNGKLDYGFIAQEVEKSLEDRKVNMITRLNDDQHTYTLRSTDMLSPTVKAIQDQQAIIKDTSALDENQKDIEALKKWLEAGQ